jgi:hypothetical protein
MHVEQAPPIIPQRSEFSTVAHYARTAAQPGGLRYLVKRTVEVAEYLVQRAGELAVFLFQLAASPFQLNKDTDPLQIHRLQACWRADCAVAKTLSTPQARLSFAPWAAMWARIAVSVKLASPARRRAPDLTSATRPVTSMAMSEHERKTIIKRRMDESRYEQCQ